MLDKGYMKVGQTISQDVINAKLFENLENIDKRMEQFEVNNGTKELATNHLYGGYDWCFGKSYHILAVYS